MPTSLSRADAAPPRTDVAFGLDAPAAPEAHGIADFLARAFGPSTAAIIHYGSQARRVDARPESAHDFFVIVDRYKDAFRALTRAVGTRFSPWTATVLARVLPPNVLAVAVPTQPVRTKCAVLTVRDLTRLCSPKAKDHFTQGRLFQQVQVVWSRDPASRDAVIGALVQARIGTFRWARPYLPERFTVEQYCRTLLETSFRAEIRPERADRVATLLAAQRTVLVRAYDALLRRLVAEGVLAFDDGAYRQLHPPDALETLRIRLHFRRSKARAILRWAKFILLYDDWLSYLVGKVERRDGMTIELTERERRWPLVFLWPKFVRYFRTRGRRQLPQ